MIDPEQIAEITDRIVQQLAPEKIILFGSYANGNAREDSDIDLLVVAETDLSARDRFPAIRRLLADFPAAFDVFWKTPEEYRRWRSVVNHVVYFAEKYGKIVYERQHAGSGAAMVG
jgi:predicted nucleotidyltransferase